MPEETAHPADGMEAAYARVHGKAEKAVAQVIFD
jgi:hypothetical protein